MSRFTAKVMLPVIVLGYVLAFQATTAQAQTAPAVTSTRAAATSTISSRARSSRSARIPGDTPRGSVASVST